MKWGDSFVSLSARTVLQSPVSGPAVLEATCKDTSAPWTIASATRTGSQAFSHWQHFLTQKR